MSKPHLKEGLGLCLLLLLLFSCRQGQTARQEGGDTVVFRYAKNIEIVRHDSFTVVKLKNPWKPGKVLHTYVLAKESHGQLPEGTFVRVPLRQSVIFTTVHSALLMTLHREQCISGVADLKYIKVPWIHQQVAQGKIADCGDGMSPVIEKIIDRKPDAILLSPFENSGGYGRLDEIHIPIIECAEYMEPTPLGRAEWIRFYGMLFGAEAEADSIFHEVDSSYHALRQLAATSKTRPTVVMDKVTGSVWYVPGGKSTIGQMIADAGGHYPYADDEHSGSVSLPFEAVLDRCGEADLWLFRFSGDHPITYQELLGEHHGYRQFKAFKEQQAYGCNVELSLFYEESPFRPDWLLNDFIRILHPEIQGLDPVRYYQKLQ